MAYSFAADAEKLQELVTLLGDGAEKIKEYEEQIYSIINSMEADGCWSGEAYNAFKTQCESYKPAIEGLHSLLLAFKLQFSKLETDTNSLSSDISNVLNS